MDPIGLIAGSGRLPFLFAQGARRAGRRIVAVGHVGETDPALSREVDSLAWVRVGQLRRISRAMESAGVTQVAMAGGIGKLKALRAARPDLAMMRIVLGLRSLGDDRLLRAIAAFFESQGLEVVAPTAFLGDLLAPEGPITDRAPNEEQARDLALGLEVAKTIGRADVGQAVVVKGGTVLAVEAAEGTDAAIRRGAQLGGEGVVVVKACKPGQDQRFDLPAVGPRTVEVLASVRGAALGVEAGRSILLDVEQMRKQAQAAGICLVGLKSAGGSASPAVSK